MHNQKKIWGTFMATVVLLEIIGHFLSIDLMVMKNLFYFVEGDYIYQDEKEIYQESDNSEILYELIPSASATCISNCIHSKEKEFTQIKYQIDKEGGREMEHPTRPTKNLLYWVGGSFSYGISVRKHDRLQNKLQQFFNKNNIDIQIIDRSANAYVTSQKIAIAEKLISQKGIPKFIIIQDSNSGRRAFFYKTKNYKSYFRKNTNLYLENFPNIFNYTYHNFFVQHSSLYRILIAAYLRIHFYRKYKECSDKQRWMCITDQKINNLFNQSANQISLHKLQQFIKKYSDKTKIILFDPLRTDSCKDNLGGELLKTSNYFRLSFCTPRPPQKEFNEIHPPSYVYKWYAKQLIEIFSVGYF